MRNTISKFKRGLSLLLSLALCLSLVTPVASARDAERHDHSHELLAAYAGDPTSCPHDDLVLGFLYRQCRKCGAWRYWFDWSNWHYETPEQCEHLRATCSDSTCPDCGDLVNVPHTSGSPVQENKVEATCAEEGSYDEVVYCSVCGKELSREKKTIDKLAHTPAAAVEESRVEATCEAEGSYDLVIRCESCQTVISSEHKTIEKTGHTPGDVIQENLTNATCGQPGSYDEVVYCSVCGDELSREQKTTSATENHSWDAGEVTTEPSCENEGVRTYTCTVCEETKTEAIDAKGHNWNDGEVTTDPTCTEAGEKTYTCTECGETKTEAMEAVGHNLISHNEFVPMCRCESYGKKAYFECRICGNLYKDKDCTIGTTEDEVLLPATGHQLVYHEAKAATCTTNGNIEHWTCSCKRCNTCKNLYFTDETGTTRMPSSKVVIKATGHDMTEVQEKAPTCTEEGNRQYWVCNNCDGKFNDKNGKRPIVNGVTIPALGHKYGGPEWSWSVTNDNTTVTLRSVTAAFKCENAGCSYEQHRIWAENTSPDMAKPRETVVPATCTEKGSVTFTASVTFNGKTYEDSYTGVISALGHDFAGEWVPNGEVGHYHKCQNDGCTAAGETIAHSYSDWDYTEGNPNEAYRTCSDCGYRQTEEITITETPDPEVWVDLGITEAATCTDTGIHTYRHKETGLTKEVVIPALDHKWSEDWTYDANEHWYSCTRCDTTQDNDGHELVWEITTNPTAVMPGQVTGTCETCGYSQNMPIAALGNNDVWNKTATTPATCTETGTDTYTFRGGNYDGLTVEVETPALGHDWSNDWIYDANEHWHSCTRCDTTKDNAGHKLVWEITTNPTTVMPGQVTGTCETCGYSQNMPIAALGDNDVWSKTTTTPATCTKTGTDTYTFHGGNYDGLTVEVETPALGHKWSAEWNRDETQHWHVCERCDVPQGTSYANHKYTWKVTVAPTAETAGSATGTCVCGKTVVETVPALNDESEWTLRNQEEATCVTNGYKVYVSESFGTQTQIIPALGHDYADVVVKEASCTEKGIMSRVCQRDGCDASEANTEIPMIPHDLEWVEEVPATCEDTGVSGHYECAACGALSIKGGTAFEAVGKEALAIPATGHSYESVVTAPTCTEDGYTTHTCSVCGDSYTDDETEATGHNYGDWTIVTAPTTEAEGTAAHTCSVCGDEETKTLPQLPTTPGETVDPTDPEPEEGVWTLSVTVDPTCTETGYYEYIHSVTALTARVDRAALGHSYSTAWTASADNHWHVCIRCGAAADTAAHTWNGGVVTRYATYTSTGERTYTCTVCAATRTETIPMLTYTPGPIIPVTPVTPSGPSNGGNEGNGDNSGSGEIDINENETPLGDGEDIGGEIDIDDNETPLASGLNLDRVAYLAGYEDGTVRPSNRITRAEVATVFYRLMSDLTRELNWADTNSFTDVEQDKWFNEAVSTAAKAGILRGYGDSSFKPNNNITRAEFATIASRFLSVDVESAAVFTDVSGHWAEEAIGIVAGAGWIKGYEDGTFRPDETITRAEAAIIINRMLGRDIADREDDTRSWIDNPLTAWFYQDIQEATNGVLLR